MGMKRRDFVLAIISLCGENREFGRTSLQKVSYLVASAFGLELRHHAYFYGPFSEAIESDVEALAFSGLIDEKRRTLGYNASGFEVSKYEYSLTEDGQERIDRLRESFADEMSRLEDFIGKLKETAGTLNQRVLSIAAKVHYIQSREERLLEAEEIAQIGKGFGWKLKSPQVTRIQNVLGSLDLAPVKGSI